MSKKYLLFFAKSVHLLRCFSKQLFFCDNNLLHVFAAFQRDAVSFCRKICALTATTKQFFISGGDDCVYAAVFLGLILLLPPVYCGVMINSCCFLHVNYSLYIIATILQVSIVDYYSFIWKVLSVSVRIPANCCIG